MNNKVKGYFLGAISAATYGMNPLFTLPLYKDGMDYVKICSETIDMVEKKVLMLNQEGSLDELGE